MSDPIKTASNSSNDNPQNGTKDTGSQAVETVNFTIDGRAVTVPKGTTVYTATKQLGIEIPIFCYYDRMPPFGACRVCLVEVEKMAKPQTSCTLVATEGMVVKTQSQMAVDGRKSILEFLLINHPLDCPVCDKGGECPLQDQALAFGPGESRFFEDKRRFQKPKPLGPVLMLDRERCVVCARCTRFGDEVAGDHALEFQERGYRTEVCTPGGGPAESKFIGNTIQMCPVGALTSQVYRFRARPWDNQPTPSTCTLCPVGCSLFLDSRDGEIMRTRSQENQAVNDVWLCDKGWFGYEYTSNPQRLYTPWIRKNGQLQPSDWNEALSLIASKISHFKSRGRLGALGGNPLTTEENYLFQQLMRQGAGVNHIDHRVGMPIIEDADEVLSPGMEISIGECEELSYAVLLGVDLTEEFPVIWLRLKQAMNKGTKVMFIGHFAPEIAPHLQEVVVHAPGEEQNVFRKYFPEISKMGSSGKKGALFIGSQYAYSENRREILSDILAFQQSQPNLSLNLLEGRDNSMGAYLAGMRPDSGPLGNKIAQSGLNAVEMLKAAASTGWDFLYVAGANPVNQYPRQLWKEAKSKLGFLVVQDLFLTETAKQADVILPTLAYVEKGGTFFNIEGRAQPLLPGKEIPQAIYSDGEIFSKIAHKLGLDLHIDPDFTAVLKEPRRQPRRLKETAKTKLPSQQNSQTPPHTEALRATFAYTLFDRGVRMNYNSHLRQLVKEPRARLHPLDAFKRNIAEGNKVSIAANGATVTAIVKIDDRVAPGTIVLPFGFAELPVHNLGANLLNGLYVELNNTFLAEGKNHAF